MQDRITIRMAPALIERIDEWIDTYPGYLSRQEAIRRLVTFALDRGCLQLAAEAAENHSRPNKDKMSQC